MKLLMAYFNIGSLSKYKIVKLNKSKISPDFDKAFNDGILKVEQRNSQDLTIVAVARGRVDLAATSRFSAIWSAHNHNLIDKIEFV